MRYLITGGCGFLGANLASYCIQSRQEVIVFDNLSRMGSSQNLQWLRTLGAFQFVHGDIRSASDVESVVKTYMPDVVFHLAGQVAMTTSLASPFTDFQINTAGSVQLLEAIRQHHPNSCIVYSSTNKVYGDLEQFPHLETHTRYINEAFPRGLTENTPLDFHSPYGCSKGAADQYMLDYARMYGLKTVVFRHSSMYGGRQYSTSDQGWIGWFCQKAIQQKNSPDALPFTISGNGKQVRDVLHVKDMINVYIAAVANIDSAKGHAFNIGGGIENSLSLLELFELLEAKLQVKLRYTNLPFRSSDQKFFVADTTKARNLLNWQPSVNADQGLSDMLLWVHESNFA
jgi:CDP-paratose 2-epimerase